MSQLPAPVRVFACLPLPTIGGGMAACPELQDLTVNGHDWLTASQVIHLDSVGQMAPGPNMMMIVSIGAWVGGAGGAVVVLIGFCRPTAGQTFVVGRLWTRLAAWPWRHSIQRGWAPVLIGLPLAGCCTVAKGAILGLETAAIAVGALLLLLRFKINPPLLVVGGAAVGVLAFTCLGQFVPRHAGGCRSPGPA